jgi:O-methyltransferase
MYLLLLRNALTHMLYRPMDVSFEEEYRVEEFAQPVAEAFERGEPVKWAEVRAEGRDWPQFAQTMVGTLRLRNVQRCIERVLADDVPGDLVEAGVWRGGVAILMRGVLAAHGDTTRRVVVADSFAGLPPPNAEAFPADAGDRHHEAASLAVPVEEVRQNFRLYGLLDDQVEFLEGWFRDTLPTVRDRQWSVVRVDGDMYESTIDALTNLYPGLSVGGFVIVDDLAHPACRQAVEDFRAAHGIDDPIEMADWTGGFWRRTTRS